MWDLMYENLGTGKPVASYFSKDGVEVFSVMETDEAFVTMPNFPFIDRTTISHDVSSKMSYGVIKGMNVQERMLLAACCLMGRDLATQKRAVENGLI